MAENDCIFCKIIKKEAPAQFVFENDEVVAIKDINPKADVHILVIPKKHIVSVDFLEESDRNLVGGIFLAIKKIAKDKNFKNYRLAIFGQLVNHLHVHLLVGKQKGELE